MKRWLLSVIGLAVMAAPLVFFLQKAAARPQYKKAFDAEYMKEGSAIFTAYKGKSSCNVCHVGKDKKKRNAYGMAFGKALGAKNEKSAEKIEAALAASAKDHSDPKDKESPTFGELIEEGKLPETK